MKVKVIPDGHEHLPMEVRALPNVAHLEFEVFRGDLGGRWLLAMPNGWGHHADSEGKGAAWWVDKAYCEVISE